MKFLDVINGTNCELPFLCNRKAVLNQQSTKLKQKDQHNIFYKI